MSLDSASLRLGPLVEPIPGTCSSGVHIEDRRDEIIVPDPDADLE